MWSHLEEVSQKIYSNENLVALEIYVSRKIRENLNLISPEMCDHPLKMNQNLENGSHSK